MGCLELYLHRDIAQPIKIVDNSRDIIDPLWWSKARLTNPENNNDVVMLLIIQETHCRYLEVKIPDCSYPQFRPINLNFMLRRRGKNWLLSTFYCLKNEKYFQNMRFPIPASLYNLQDINICELIVQKLSIILCNEEVDVYKWC